MTESRPKIERQKDYIVVRDAYDVVAAYPIASTVIVDDSVQEQPAVWLDSGTRAGRRVRGWTVDEVLDAIYGAETTRRGELQPRILDALRELGPSYARSIAAATGAPYQSVRTTLWVMVRCGAVERRPPPGGASPTPYAYAIPGDPRPAPMPPTARKTLGDLVIDVLREHGPMTVREISAALPHPFSEVSIYQALSAACAAGTVVRRRPNDSRRFVYEIAEDDAP